MINLLLELLKATGGWNKKREKAIIYHPLAFLTLVVFFQIAVIICIFTDDDIVSTIKYNFTSKLN